MALATSCAPDPPAEPVDQPQPVDAAALVSDGDGYTFRRISSEGTEILIEQGFGPDVAKELVMAIAKHDDEAVGSVEVMVLNEPITPRQWVETFYPDLEHEDVSARIGARTILFTGSAHGTVMRCRTQPDPVLVRAVSTLRREVLDVTALMSERCADPSFSEGA